jgi:hypothetical protein
VTQHRRGPHRRWLVAASVLALLSNLGVIAPVAAARGTGGDGLPDRSAGTLDSTDPLTGDMAGYGITAPMTDTDHDGLPDAWEIRYGVTDPLRRDSNGDGVPDSAEDPDGDGLSNLGELRFHTSPSNPDSNGNGIPDGLDDANHDGRPDGLEQDRRPVPHHLVPTLSGAAGDVPPSYHDGCNIPSTIRAFRACSYGDTTSTKVVVLFGDSHAAQWLPALIVLGDRNGWRIVSLTRSGCPSADVTTFNKQLQRIDTDCADYRAQALVWIHRHRPATVIITNLSSYGLYDSSGHPVAAPDREKVWRKGLAHTIQALPAASHALVLADTPYPGIEVPVCLANHPTNIAACERSRAKMVAHAHAAGERRTALAHKASFADLSGRVCSYDPCPAIVDGLLIYRDHSHLTATYSRQLAPSLRAALRA